MYEVDDMKFITTKMNKTSIWGGVGSAVFLVLLMALMPFGGIISAPMDEVDSSLESDTAEAKADPFALPVESSGTIDLEDRDPAKELLGMRSLTQKGYVEDNGDITVLTFDDPIHYVSEGTTWEEINTNVVSTPWGWEVSENLFRTSFAGEVSSGVAVQAHPNADPIIVGIQPTLVTLDVTGSAMHPVHIGPVEDAISTGGNTIRYPLGQGYDLDYQVGNTEVKQNLIIRDQPVIEEGQEWFGLSEMIRMPAEYALYVGEVEVGDEIIMTQEPLQVRHIETGELLVEFPTPTVIEPGNPEIHTGTYFVSVFKGGQVVLTTAVESSWLMDMNRSYPINLDPTIKVTQSGGNNGGGYCYVYYGYCYDNTAGYLYRYYGSIYYIPWHRYDFSAQNLGTAAYPTKVEWKMYRSYYFSYSSNSATARFLENCGTDQRYNYGVTSASCSGDITASLLSGTNSNVNERKLVSSIWNSRSLGSVGSGTGWKTVSVCSSQTACASGDGLSIFNAMNGGGTKGVGLSYSTSTYFYTYSYNSGSSKSYYAVSYGGASDTAAPVAMNYAAYTGLTSYKEGARTFFIDLKDNGGIDTTTSGGPFMYYSINNGTYTKVSASNIGTCSTTTSQCQFRATTGALVKGDYVTYYWEYTDLSSNANSGTTPSGGSTSPHYFQIDAVEDAGSAKKFQVQLEQRSAYSSYQPQKYFDQLMTYYDDSNEFVFEFDTSDCGTGSQSCFYTSNYYFYQMWKMKWTTSPSSGYNGFGGTLSGQWNMMADVDNGFITLTADDGPGMNLIYLYDSSANRWSVTGLDTSTGIDETLSGGTTKNHRGTYGYTKHWNIKLDNIYGTVGKFDFNGSYSSSRANWLCQSTDGFVYFFRSTSSNPGCNGGYYYAYSSSYRWTGFAIGTGYYGSMSTTGGMSYKASKVAPEPDRTAPEMTHSELLDSHSKKRTISVTIVDGGEPPSGLNTSNVLGVGPTLSYRQSGSSTWFTTLLAPVGASRAECKTAACEWSATLDSDSGTVDTDFMERGKTIEYKISSQDLNSDSAGANDVETSVMSFEVGDPNKVFIIEWHDVGYFNNQYACTFQVLLYDETNEIEFKYDTGCSVYYDYATIGYQNQARNIGASIDNGVSGYLAGGNAFSSNYRIATDGSTNHGWEKFDLGQTDITNYNVAIQGSSNGEPRGYYCTSSYWWNTYKAGCDANIDLPDGFSFDYFGNTFDGNNSNSRVLISRYGAMSLKSTSSTSPERAMTTWGTNMPDLPYSSNTYSRANLIAPWWGYYSSYYCYTTSSTDCSVRYRVMPFEGKGTDVDASSLTDVDWDLMDSPIRVNPPGDYLSITGNMNIDPGVVIQVANGKGISFDGSCSNMNLLGNSTDHVLFEGQGGQTWKGMAFTAGCSSGTDERHAMTYVDFANTSDAAISAGSRHGASPSTNSNVGNFTMTDVTFKNVGSAVSHGSGDGTSFAMVDVDVEDSSGSCFDFPTDAVVTMNYIDMDGCNTGGSSTGGAIVNDAGSTGGSLLVENATIADSYVNLISSDLASITINNVAATHSATQSGVALEASAGATGSSLSVYNLDTSYYSSVTINTLGNYNITDSDFGDTNIAISPSGASSTASGAHGASAILDNVDAGALSMARTAPTMTNVDLSGALTISGNSPTTDRIYGDNVDADGVSIQGCGYTYLFTDMDLDAGGANSYVSSSCSSSNAPNSITIDGGTIATASSGADNVIYARNSKVTLGSVAITGMTAMGSNVAKASSNGIISLIGVTWNGDDCADADGWTGASDCWVQISSSSGQIFFGGTASVKVYKWNDAAGVRDYKSGHIVNAEVVDGSGSPLFIVGRHITDGGGEVDAWVLSESLSGSGLSSTNYIAHNLFGYGPAGVNETFITDPWYPTVATVPTFGVGDSIELELFPAPVDLGDANMDCAWLASNSTIQSTYDPDMDSIYEFDSNVVTLSADLTLDSCSFVLIGATLKIKSDATTSPTLILSGGSSVTLTKQVSNSKLGTIRAQSSAYPLHIDIQDGLLWIDEGIVKDVAQSGTTGSALLIGPDATLKMTNGGKIYGLAANSDDMATVEINGGTLEGDNGHIINTGGTGTGIWFENTMSGMANLHVSGAAVGIKSYNAAPQLDGFTVETSDVGISLYGGMSLPTIYRSTSLSGMNAGWNTYSFDISTFMDKDYVQLGYNSIWAGGNAHPRYNYATSKYYMMTDRMWVEFELDTNADGAADLTYNHSDRGAGTRTSPGYYDGHDGSGGTLGGAGSDTSGEYAGYNYWDCNLYGYVQNPAFRDYGYYYYLISSYYQGQQGISGAYASSGTYYGAGAEPDNFGYRWEAADDLSSSTSMYYPYHYWGYYYTSYHAYNNPAFYPPEGFNGMFGSYNICMDYYYTGYSPGLSQAGNRVSMPIIDMTNEGDGAMDRNNVAIPEGKIVGATLNIDFFHNRADNYQDRIELVTRSSNDIGDLSGETWAREAGTPLIKGGTIDDADVGIEIGGGYAAAAIEDMTVNTPTSSGMVISGSAFSAVDGLTVTGGDYCVRTSLTAAGRVDLDNLNCQNQQVAGVSYQRDISGSFSGTISGSQGAAVEYGSATTTDHDFIGLTLTTNSIGMSMGGKGSFTLAGCTFANTNYDIAVPGSSEVTFIDGTIDDNKTSVTGTGVIKRARSLSITLTEDTDANVSNVIGANILLMGADSSIQGSSTTDGSGVAGGILYTTMERTNTGATWPDLGGYTAATAAKVEYVSSGSDRVMDFRYKIVSVTLDPDAPSTGTITLEETDMIPYRVCYSFSSSSYGMLASCSIGSGATRTYDNDNADGDDDHSTGIDATEYGYFGATPKDMSGKTILMDVPFMYVGSDSSSSTKNNWNNTNLIITGNYDYNGYQRWTSTYPYNSHLYMDGMTAYSLSTTQAGVHSGVMFGYFAWSDINPWITNSTIVGLTSIAAGRENTNWDPDHFNVADNTFVRAGGPGSPKTSFGYQEMCIVNSGIHDAVVTNNDITGCPIGVMIRNIVYTYYFTRSTWGPDDMMINGNNFTDTGTISLWFYFSYGDDISVKDNNFGGSTAPTYHVYGQSAYTTGLVVDSNTFTSGNQPIYLRGTLNYDVKNNDITGNRNQAHPGIYTLNGYGSISGNTLTDADGGIMIDGVRSGQSLTVTDNTIAPSAGRTAPGAVGIWAEDCGATTLITGGNDVTTVMNGLVVDGCAISDTGSKFTGTGGVGGASWSVDVMASYYAPQNQTIGEDDSIRWRAKEYYNNSGTGETHTVTSDANSTEVFDSGTMNLGSTFAHTFDTAGTYYYHCTNHAFMTGSVIVTTSGSASFTANGINVVSSGNKVISLNGTEVGGYSTGVTMSGGNLELTGGARIAGVGYALYLDGVDVSTSGANLDANDTSGIGLYLTNGGSLDLNDLSTGAAYGVYTDGVDFNWNGGTVSGGTALYADNRAEGDFQNITFDTGLTQQIYAGSNTIITSVGNSLDSTKLGIDPTAIIHEANLLTLDTDRNEDYTSLTPATPSEDIGLMITSTDGTKAAFVSTTFRDTSPSIDGNISDWDANPLNPSDNMMPGIMSEDGDNVMGVTWDAQNLYIGIAGADMDSGDLMVYIGHGASGTSDSLLWDNMQHDLPFLANYAFWAEDGSNPPKDGDTTYTWGLKSWSTGTNTWSDISEGCTWNQDSAYIGWSSNDVTEISIPWSCIGSPIGDVRLLGTVLNESDGEVNTVHPNPDDFTLAGGNESFTDTLSITLGQLNLQNGGIDDYRLIYRSYLGTTTASAAKNYDVMVVGDAPCAEDWGTISDISMATNYAGSITIERACPFISAPSFVTVTTTDSNLTGTGYMVGFEDMPMQTIPLMPYGVDIQTSAIDIGWDISDHPNPQFAPTTLLEYYQWGVKGVTTFETGVTVDHDGDDPDGDGFSDSSDGSGSAAATPELVEWYDHDSDATTAPVAHFLPAGNNQMVNLTVLPNQFGNYNVKLVITDEHGLTDTGYLTVIVLPINDAPVIWNFGHTNNDLAQGFTPYGTWSSYGLANVPVFVTDSDGVQNVADEGHGTVPYKLGTAVFGLTTDTTYIYDQLNEQPQAYTWGASVPAACEAFSVSISNGSEILIDETTSNEKGGECDITLTLSDDGTDAFPISYVHPLLGVDIYGWTFNDASPKAVTFRINPVNDAPYIHSSFVPSTREIVDGTGTPINLEWAITVQEDTTDVAKTTFNLSQMKADIDHDDDDLFWTFQRHYVETTGFTDPQLQCEYDNYFSAISIDGDEMSFTLIPDATTNAPPEQVDKMDDGGIHQARPDSQEGYCFIEMYVHDSLVAPAYIPNYGFDTATYNNASSQLQILKIKVDNTLEPVPDYFFDDSVGFNFHGVSHVISGTEVPMSVDIVAGGDAPPNTDGTYKYDHILEVTFKSDGHQEGDQTAGRTIFVDPPENGERITVKHPGVPIMDESKKVSVYVDVKTCLAETCPAPVNVSADDFVNDNPEAHVCSSSNDSWSCPGLFQDLADRRPQLEDKNFSNNIMTNMVAPDDTGTATCGSSHPYLCLSTGQSLPEIVATQGLASVPSFAPSIMMVSLMGMFVGAMLAMGRRDEEDDDYTEELEDDEAAVSPVIATILMVAITVVLSGVIYVWASSLANTDQKTVPRLGMKVVDVNPDAPTGYWRLDVTDAKTELSSQGIIVQLEWAGGVYQTSLTNATNYGFVPTNVPDSLRANAPVIVTFADNVNCDDDGKNCVTTFGVGDSILIGSHDTNGNKISDLKVTIRYDPGAQTATLLQTFKNLN